jgi:hypothetical protein
MKARLSELAREFSWVAFDALADVAENGSSETARVAAATALLDRGFGKPREAGMDQFLERKPWDIDL